MRSNSPDTRIKRRSKSPARRKAKSRSPRGSRSRSRSNSTESSRSSRASRPRKETQGKSEINTSKSNLGVKITHLPLRSSDTSLRDGLFHEYKKHGKVTGVVIEGKEANRLAIVSFKKPEEAEKALEASKEKHFFGSQIRVEPHVGFICDAPEEEAEEPEYDEYHIKATRTLFCGNLEPHTSSSTLRDTFRKYGEIVVGPLISICSF
ncbi:msx2-interacting protein-like [Watersipora subatra]|uniref:msx2-interacting protein-like n=1 Tax=Watersipora subatra TaxID=2589382 RepID=UPI00355BC53F